MEIWVTRIHPLHMIKDRKATIKYVVQSVVDKSEGDARTFKEILEKTIDASVRR